MCVISHAHSRLNGKFKISKSLNFLKSNLKTCSMPTNINNFKFKLSIVFRQKINQGSYKNPTNSGFSFESQPKNPEFKKIPENFHPCV